jgi:hypothetical protein
MVTEDSEKTRERDGTPWYGLHRLKSKHLLRWLYPSRAILRTMSPDNRSVMVSRIRGCQ